MDSRRFDRFVGLPWILLALLACACRGPDRAADGARGAQSLAAGEERPADALLRSEQRTFLVWRFDQPFCATIPGVRLRIVSLAADGKRDWGAWFTAVDPLLREHLTDEEHTALIDGGELPPSLPGALERLRGTHLAHGLSAAPLPETAILREAPGDPRD